jgi:hypothetical protein
VITEFVNALPRRDWRNLPIGAYDFETTAADPLTAHIIQVGAGIWQPDAERPTVGARWVNPHLHKRIVATGTPAKYEAAIVAHVKTFFPAPPDPRDKSAWEAIGLTPAEMLAIYDAPDATQTLERLAKGFREVPVMCGWNCGTRLDTGFDCRIVSREAARYGVTLTDRPFLDVMPFACQMVDDVPNRQLGTIGQHFGIDVSGSHRAGADCLTTMLILQKLAPKLPGDLAELLELSVRWSQLSWWLKEEPGGYTNYRVNCGKWRGTSLGDMARDRAYRGGREYLSGWMLSKSDPPVQAIVREVLS